MTESRGRYLPVLRQQLFDATDPESKTHFENGHYEVLLRAVGETALGEQYPERLETLRALAGPAILATEIMTPESLGSQVTS